MLIDTTRAVERNGSGNYCGPTVVAAITGTSTAHVEEAIFRLRREGLSHKGARRSGVLRRTRTAELLAVLARHGFSAAPVDCGARYRAYRRNVVVNSDFTRMARATPILSAEPWTPASIVKLEGLLLWQWAARLADKTATYIVNTPGHWALYSAGRWCETFTRGEWVDMRAAPGQRRRVELAYLVTKGVQS